MAPRLRLVSSLAAAAGGGARCWHAAWDAEGGALLTAGSDRAVRVWRARGAAAGAAQVRALARAAGPLHALARERAKRVAAASLARCRRAATVDGILWC